VRVVPPGGIYSEDESEAVRVPCQAVWERQRLAVRVPRQAILLLQP